MKKKIVGLGISMLLFATALSVAGTIFNEKTNTFDDIWWPMFHKDPIHSGFSTSSAPETKNVFWDFQTEGEVYSSPAVVDGKVYFGSEDNKTYCLSASDGGELWNYMTEGIVSSSPAVVSEKVYIGSLDGKMYCLNANNGDEIWTYPTGDVIYSSPTVVNDKIYFGGFDGNIYCLNAENGNEIWKYEVEDQVFGSPAVADGKVYIGSLGGEVLSLDADGNGDGTTDLIWYNTTNHMLIFASPTVVNGRVYIGDSDGYLYCFNAENGDQIWIKELSGQISSTAAIDNDDNLYIASKFRMVYCLNSEDGSEIWTYETNDFIYRSSPVVADGKVYIGDITYEAGRIYCLNSENGNKIWDYVTGNKVVSSPAVADGKLYVGSTDGKVYCFYTLPEPDLDCEGTLSWTEIKPGETVTGEFTIENVGESESELDWKIESFPDWGDWTFDPESGEDLTPEDGDITIEVELIAPDEENEDFEGEIKIVNLEDSGDHCSIQISLSTPVKYVSPFMQLLDILIQRVPFLRLLYILLLQS